MRIADVTAALRRAPPWTLTLAAASTSLFALLAALVALRLTGASDLGWTLAFQSVASDPLDVVANGHTLLGQLVVTLALAAVVSLVTWRRLGGWAALAPALILATGAVELVFKLVLPHPSPPQEFVRAFHNVLGIRGPASAFPSGHVARLTFLALLVAALYPARWTSGAVVVFVALTVFLRVYIGDHWVSDALAGVALGTGAGALAVGWMRATATRR